MLAGALQWAPVLHRTLLGTFVAAVFDGRRLYVPASHAGCHKQRITSAGPRVLPCCSGSSAAFFLKSYSERGSTSSRALGAITLTSHSFAPVNLGMPSQSGGRQAFRATGTNSGGSSS